MSEKLRLIGINLLVFIVLILGLEGASRLLLAKSEIKPVFHDAELRTRNRPFVEPHPARGFALKPGFQNELYSVNSAGFRGPNSPLPASTQPVILAMGESTTFGWGVKDTETYPFYLEQALRNSDQPAQSAPVVINAGIPSYSSAQTLAYMQELLAAKDGLKPDLILVNILWNDLWYSTIQNWDPQILIYQQSPPWLTLLTRYSTLAHYLIMGSQQEQRVDIFNAPAMDTYLKNVTTMLDLARQHGVQVALVEPPFDADHMPENGLNEFHTRYTRDFLITTARKHLQALYKNAQLRNVPILTHRLDLRTLNQPSLFLDPLHPTAEGNQLMAEDIASQLQSILTLGR